VFFTSDKEGVNPLASNFTRLSNLSSYHCGLEIA
jgi:hypothetical protein